MANQLRPEGFGGAVRSFFGWVAKWGDVLTTIVFLSVVIVYGLNRIILHQETAPNTALMWALACMGAGALLGFLFGIPRVLQGDNPPPGTPGDGGAAATGAAGRTGSDGQPVGSRATAESYGQLVNTNLEQISDWLTKIIVGLGLVELRNIPDYVRRLSAYAAGQGFEPQSETFAAALIVYFSVIGFMGGYLTTRLWLAGAFSRADRMSSGLSLTGRERRNFQQSELNLGAVGEPQLAGIDAETARRNASVSLDKLNSPEEIAIWAKSQFKLGNYGEAVKGYAKAVALAPDNIRCRLEYAAALYYAGRPVAEAREQLIEAYTRVRNTPGVDPNLKKQVYRSLTFQSLYVDPPVGFSDVIKYGEEFFAEGGQSGDIATNLAAAYGQQYKWLKENGSPEALKTARDHALKYVKLAISINERWKERLRQLLQKDYPGKDSAEDDLEVFEQDEDFRKELDLPTIPPAKP